MNKLIFFTLGLVVATACAPPEFLSPYTPPAKAAISRQNAVMQHRLAALHTTFYNKRGHVEAVAYICNNAERAMAVQTAYGIPAEITLAVGMLESGKGSSNIAHNARNHFGIKRGDGWRGATFTCANNKQWRAYNSIDDSYADFGRFIMEHVPEFVENPSVEAFAKTGYAGKGRKAGVYAALLNSIISRYQLRELFAQN